MFLKSLEIFGFKSFADRTRIEFADGITALLGPNGCGKSNVVDAVKWVLGEQAAKTMRAEKMEDIIFNGTESRKALSVAEVTLTIANDNGLLPLDVSEITIKRRLYRSGESEYFINGASVKLKDIRELFWDTGVGKTAYSVMEQGKIDQILSSKPEDRRYLFEEAAGITRFKVKRAEAERKLERTEENMRQIESILAEVKRSYDTLKIQAEKTIKYRTLREEVFYFELDIQLLRLRGITQDRDRRADEVQKTVSRRDSILAEKNEIDRFLQENMDAVNDLEKQIAESNNQLVGLMVERREKGERAKELAEQQKSTKAKISQLEGRRYAIEEKIESLQEDIGEQEAAVHELNGRIADIKKNIASFTENITHTESRIGENDRQAAKSAQEIEDLDR
ncbi:MAG: AAA family ATPase, partial [Spirochaetaceae bacterium]|nr:AAA family ATPase [Spirochaetaceae bacterium]